MARTLVVPLDGSELAEHALPWATTLARTYGLSLVLVRVIPWPPYIPMGEMGGYVSSESYEQALAAEREATPAYLEQVRQRVAGQGLSVEAVGREGKPVDVILELAAERGAFAIAMATHGRGGLTRLFMGSVAEQVLQKTTVPLLLVRATDGRPGPEPALRRLLVPVDGSPLAERAVEVARKTGASGATLVLVQVVAPVTQLVPGGDGVGVLADEKATEHAVAEAKRYLGRLAPAIERDRFLAVADVRVGKPAEEILAAADAHAVDLIVMSTHGRTGPSRWLMGSVADEVVRHARQPVFLVRQ